jgi:hypothetical protein
MTKLEFLDKINDILAGLNTLESDLLGSLYDELMRDAGWRPGSELPPLDKKNGNSQDLIVICGTMNFHCDLPRWSSVVGGVWGDKDVKWWCYPPENK